MKVILRMNAFKAKLLATFRLTGSALKLNGSPEMLDSRTLAFQSVIRRGVSQDTSGNYYVNILRSLVAQAMLYQKLADGLLTLKSRREVAREGQYVFRNKGLAST